MLPCPSSRSRCVSSIEPPYKRRRIEPINERPTALGERWPTSTSLWNHTEIKSHDHTLVLDIATEVSPSSREIVPDFPNGIIPARKVGLEIVEDKKIEIDNSETLSVEPAASRCQEICFGMVREGDDIPITIGQLLHGYSLEHSTKLLSFRGLYPISCSG
jgi:hypothetical protein